MGDAQKKSVSCLRNNSPIMTNTINQKEQD